MKKSFIVILTIVFVVAISYAFTKKSADPGWKNLKILPKNITQHQMDSVMDHYSVALNVECKFCHVKVKGSEEWDYASDSNKHKLVAREMMTMTNKLNDQYFPYGGKAEDMATDLTVTCYTCHQGRKHPLVKPREQKTGNQEIKPLQYPLLIDSTRKQ